MDDSKEFKDFKKYCLIKGDDISGIGNLPSKEGYNRVRININYLQAALDILKKYKFDDDGVVIFVKDNGLIQIGKENIGVVIAPMVDDEIDTIHGCDEPEQDCPKDADTTELEEMCDAEHNAYGCTRKKGHSGKHHAHDCIQKCHAVW